MKLPIIEALRTEDTGIRIAVTPRLSITMLEPREISEALLPYHRKFRSTAIFQIDQIANDEREIPHLHKQAERVLMHEVYGPVQERLMEILKMLWEAGPIYDDKIAKAVDGLISDLKP